MIMYSKETVFVFLLLFCLNIQAQKSIFGKDPGLKGALVSFAVSDAHTGEILAADNPDQRLCPASVWKLFTTATALDLLGADFRFRTLLAYDGKIEGGVLKGNLFIIGGGDPSLGSKYFAPSFENILLNWALAVKKAGIDSITGKVVANAAHFQGDGMPRTRIWEDMGNYYGAPVWGLNINDNTYRVDFKVPHEPGLLASVLSVNPEVPGLELKSEVVSAPIRSDQAYIFGAPYDNQRTVRGTLPAGRDHFEIKGSLPNAPLFAAYHLQKALVSVGVKTGGGITVELETLREPATLKLLAEHFSPPLKDLVGHINKVSDNLYAESLLLQIGLKKGNPGFPGSVEILNNNLRDVCQKDYPFYAYDGSGLSRFTAVSSAQVLQLLNYAMKREDLKKNLLGKLPLAGLEGSMTWFGRNTVLANNLRGKSGSMEKVKAYAGVFKSATGRELTFAAIVNNFDGEGPEIREKIEAALIQMYKDY